MIIIKTNAFYNLLILLALVVAMLWVEHAIFSANPLASGQQIIKGQIIGLVSNHRSHVKFTLRSGRHHVLLNWYGPHPMLLPGQIWQLKTRIKPRNIKSSFSKVMQAHGWTNEGYVVKSAVNQLQGYRLWGAIISIVRYKIRQLLLKIGVQDSMIAIILALAIGDRSGFTPQIWHVFQNTATGHLVAIAGLHVGLVALIGMQMGRYMLWPGVVSKLIPVQKTAPIFGLVLALCYGALSGFAIPTIRAVVMIAFYCLSQIMGIKWSIYMPIVMALCVVFSVNPQAGVLPGTWLSFMAVFFLVIEREGRLQSTPHWQHMIRPQWVLIIGLLPISVYFFQQFSFVGVLANLIAIPVMMLLVVPILMMVLCALPLSLSCAQFLLGLDNLILHVLWQYLAYLSHLPWAITIIPKEPWFILVLANLGALWLILPGYIPARFVGIILMSTLLWRPDLSPQAGKNKVTIWHSHQQSFKLIQSHQHTVLSIHSMTCRHPFAYSTYPVVRILRAHDVRDINTLILQWPKHCHMTWVPKAYFEAPLNAIRRVDIQPY